MNKSRWIIAGILTASLAISIVIYSYIQLIQIPPPVSPRLVKHIFKIKEIYPTKSGGREWFIDMANPKADKLFDPGSPIYKQPDGSWQIGGKDGSKNEEDQVRMKIGTSEDEPEWKNVETTGYAKVLWADSPSDHIDWYARGGKHSSSVPCEGSALKGWISTEGTVSWIKEIWHTGGYTKARDTHKVTGSIVNRWIGWKVVMYNVNNNKAVKMESYIDDNDNNIWKKVSEIVDNGGWFAKSSDIEFYSADCGRAKDYVITNSGPLVTFRSDNMMWDFSDLSVREIQPPMLLPSSLHK
ncbi:MAG: hypothetical protein WA421_09530 [Nitrososphaeraceae archaeon]